MIAPYSEPPRENILRGTLFALIAIPVGATLWVVIWNLGFIASIVSFGVALAAVWLYSKGSGGRVGAIGATLVAMIVLVTLLAGFYFGLVSDYARLIGEDLGVSPFEILRNDAFWPSFAADFGLLLQANGANLAMSLAFGALGAFSILRNVFKAANASAAAMTSYPTTGTGTDSVAPPAPQADPQPNADSTGTTNASPATDLPATD
jgi:hypothetical protein